MVVVRKMPGDSDEAVIRKFSRAVVSAGIIQEAKRRQFHLKPSAARKQKAEDQRKIQNILRYFDTLKANAASYKQSQDVKNQQQRQEELAQEQENKQKDFQKTQKKQQAVEVYRAQRKSEIKVKGG